MLDFGFYNMDCMDGMKEFPDKYFDLAIVDPPYGGCGTRTIIHDGEKVETSARFGGWFNRYKSPIYHGAGHWKYADVPWDIAPGKEYFDELFRVSKNQIIWGGNYFELPPTRCFIIWRKPNITEKFSMAMGEYAWTSFNDNAKIWSFVPNGQKGRFHPTQKPIELYLWLMNNYAKQGDIILDTHVGSASSLIACYETNHKYVGFEIDEEYYRKASERLKNETAQLHFDFCGENDG